MINTPHVVTKKIYYFVAVPNVVDAFFCSVQKSHGLVPYHVLLQVRLLSETLTTVCNLAYKWAFLGVRPQMIKKILPFATHQGTVFEVALQDFKQALGAWVLVE